jgi:hypothetical protein
MNDSEVITEELLGPATYDMNLIIIIKDLLHRTAIAKPIEHRAPEILLVFQNAPATASSFADKRMEVALLFGALSRIEANRAQRP